MDYEVIIAQKDRQIAELTALCVELKTNYEQRLENLNQQIIQLKRLIYGKKSERFIPELGTQPNLFSHLEQGAVLSQEETSPTQTITYSRKAKSDHKGRQLLSQCGHLPLEEEILDIEHTEASQKIGEVVTEKLAFKPGKLYRRRIIRPKYKDLESGEIKIADPLDEPIEKCEADVSLLAHIAVSKFVDHLPEYRQLEIFKREGVNIPSSTINNWTHQTAELVKPMADHLHKEIIQSAYIQMDESTIKVLAGKKNGTHLGYMWVLNNPQSQYVSFNYHKGRGKDAPLLLLNGYKGKLQTDGYETYDHITKYNTSIEHYNCMAHARRYFEHALDNDKARATYALEQIQKLYKIEERCNEGKYTAEQRTQHRKLAIPILDQLYEWLDNQVLMVTPKSPIGKAISYALNRWDKLKKYSSDGIVEIDNNLVENRIRPLALGRKNYLFAGSHEAAQNIAHYYTVFGTCKALAINPYNYLVWYLQRINNTSILKLASISPTAYKNSLTIPSCS